MFSQVKRFNIMGDTYTILLFRILVGWDMGWFFCWDGKNIMRCGESDAHLWRGVKTPKL